MNGTLVGFKRFKSKAGKDLCVANVVTPYNQRDLEKGYSGSDAQQIFLPEHQVNMLTDKDVGKTVQLLYEVSNGRAYLTEFVVK